MPKQLNNQPSEAVKYIVPVLNRLKKFLKNMNLLKLTKDLHQKWLFKQ